MLPNYKQLRKHLLNVELTEMKRQPINEDFFKKVEKVEKEQKVRDDTYIDIRPMPKPLDLNL